MSDFAEKIDTKADNEEEDDNAPAPVSVTIVAPYCDDMDVGRC